MSRTNNAQGAVGRRLAASRWWVARGFGWHVTAFLALNAALNLANAAAGAPWWAFWPLAVTGLLLGLHYLTYKAVTANEQWVEERVEDLNLKSYDRSHIEELKARLGPGDTDTDRRPLPERQ